MMSSCCVGVAQHQTGPPSGAAAWSQLGLWRQEVQSPPWPAEDQKTETRRTQIAKSPKETGIYGSNVWILCRFQTQHSWKFDIWAFWTTRSAFRFQITLPLILILLGCGFCFAFDFFLTLTFWSPWFVKSGFLCSQCSEQIDVNPCNNFFNSWDFITKWQNSR